jgi:hypothetical protein
MNADLNADDSLADDGWTLAKFEEAVVAADAAGEGLGEIKCRFYTQCTDTQFLVVGVFAVVEAAERNTYFMWDSDGWCLIDEAKFTYYRDDVDTIFAEASEAELALVAPWVSSIDSSQCFDRYVGENAMTENTEDPLADEPWTLAGFERAVVAANDAASKETQTFYSQCTDTQFLVVGIFTTVVRGEVTQYFRWQTDHWSSISEGMFDYYRNDSSTHLVETAADQIEQVEPGATTAPLPEAEVAEEQEKEEEEDVIISFTRTEMVDQAGRASAIAALAHRGQTDKLGYPYIDHPARVASAFDRIFEPVEHCAAWLHDVIEDSDVTAQDLLDAGIWPVVVEAVLLLTRTAEVTNEDYYELIRVNRFARAVKLADIADNLAPWRVRQLDRASRARLSKKYKKALTALGAGGDE